MPVLLSRWYLILLFIFAFTVGGGVASGQEKKVVNREYKLKASLLFKLSRFIKYSPSKKLPKNRLIMGVLGDSPMTGELRKIAAILARKKKRMTVLHFKKVQDIKPCHMLFIARNRWDLLGAVKNLGVAGKVKGKRVSGTVLVGDTRGFAGSRKGCMINFFIHENKINFEINIDAERRAGVKISSKVLRLAVAKIVRD